MIRIKKLNIKEFRGIRQLELDLGGDNFGICGPNGTGKSGIVDAIEFCITGDITRLSGVGSRDVSVSAHAPHVDQKSHPEKACVTLTADIPSLGKEVNIHRSVKNPKNVTVSPDDSDVKGVIGELQSHPEFALSRREIVKYIITPAGERSKDVQTLLRLDYLEKLRSSFTTFKNKCDKEAAEDERTYKMALTDLKTALGVDSLDAALILEKINEKRELLGLKALSELTKDTSLKSGVVEPDRQVKPKLRKAEALADMSALQSVIEEAEPALIVESRETAQTALATLQGDEKALTLVRQQGFVRTGLDLVTQDACPLCDIPWNAEELRELLRNKLVDARETTQLLGKIKDSFNAILEPLTQRMNLVDRVLRYCKILDPPITCKELDACNPLLSEIESGLSGFLVDQSNLEPALQAASRSWWSPNDEQRAEINKINMALNALPEISTADGAIEFLTVIEERYRRVQDASIMAEQSKEKASIAKKVLDHYNLSHTKVLEEIYDKVADDFSKYYRVINHEDEESLVGKLTSVPAKLSFDVDFYGRGLFPPGAYHSEGHQDAMGLCLYLALMKHTLGDNFTFAVLDDVLMSVDAGHRRDVCRLLKSEFPRTQFVLTTHDKVWLQYMKTEGMIARSQSFAGWTVDAGPRVWDDRDIWNEIQSELDRGDVAKAAWLLRNYLEYVATIIADNLRAKIEFRSDGSHDLGDMLPQTLKKWRKLLEAGEKSAERWGRNEEKAALASKRAQAKELIAKTSTEQWAINPAVHFNEWANLQNHEFQEVVDAFKNLLQMLCCENCKSFQYVLPRRGKAEEMRCNCGATGINLKLDA